MLEKLFARPAFFIVGGICILGALLRFYRIDFQSLWVDELYSIVPTAPEQSISSIVEYCKKDQPPAFFLIIHFVFKIFGYSSLVGRCTSAVIGVLAIPLMYLLGKEVKRRNVGLIAALLTSINFFHIYYSQEVRFYSLTFLLTVLSYLFFLRAVRSPRLKYFALYGFATSLLLYTHYFGMFVFASQAIAFLVLVYYKRDTKFIVYGIVSGLLVVVTFAPWLPTIISDLEITSQTFWISKPKPWFLADYFYRYTGKDALTTLIFVVLIFFFAKSYRDHRTTQGTVRFYWMIIIWLVVSYSIPYIKSMISTPILHERYTIIALPAWILVFSIGLMETKSVRTRKVLVVVLILAAIVNLGFFRKYYSKVTKEQFREASLFVIRNNPDNLPVYSPVEWHYNFYFRNEDHQVIRFYQSERKHLDRIWFLSGHFSEAERTPLMKLVFAEFDLIQEHQFHGAEALLLQRKKGID